MQKIILIACGSKKENEKAKAKDLYISPLFKKSMNYAKEQNPDKIFILSALHHLLEPDEEIEPYDVTLSNVPKNKRKDGLKVLNAKEKKVWGKKIIELLEKKTDLKNDQFIFFAGKEYIKHLENDIPNKLKPLEHLSIGQRLKFLYQNKR